MRSEKAGRQASEPARNHNLNVNIVHLEYPQVNHVWHVLVVAGARICAGSKLLNMLLRLHRRVLRSWVTT